MTDTAAYDITDNPVQGMADITTQCMAGTTEQGMAETTVQGVFDATVDSALLVSICTQLGCEIEQQTEQQKLSIYQSLTNCQFSTIL